MESQRLEKLVVKFWEAQCTELEEQALREVMMSTDAPEGYGDLKKYFSFTQSEREISLVDESFDANILQKIEGKRPRIIQLNFLLRIAAMLVVVFGMTFIISTYYNQESQSANISSEFIDTYEDPEVAYAEVKKALMMLSSNMNDGLSHTEMLGEFDKATTQIELKKLK